MSEVIGTADEIVSRKRTQLADIGSSTAQGYLRVMTQKYMDGLLIADTPTTRAMGLDRDVLRGRQILEVPVQMQPVPQAVLDNAADREITIRDIEGRIHQ